MKDNLILKKEALQKLIDDLLKDGVRVVAPVRAGRLVEYAPIKNHSEMVRDYINPRNAFKEFLFPQTEPIAEYRALKKGVELDGVLPKALSTVVIGSRPCDAACTASLRSVFTWGADDDPERYSDDFFTKRDTQTTVISIACLKGDEDCFCTTVGIRPDGEDGSDILLKETVKDNFMVFPSTDKGKDFIKANKKFFVNGGEDLKEIEYPQVIKGIEVDAVKRRLKKTDIFDDPVWEALAGKCIGCGACTFSCPTCHCFDIVDELSGYEGRRQKNWDACQLEYFTLHASGHNPRNIQPKRWRNRFLCKFHIYPTKFSSTGCVGCGRCIRVCPVGLDITEVMEELSADTK